MRRISFQWRITLMTAFLIAVSCIILNILLYHSGSYYFDTLGGFVMEYDDGSKLDESVFSDAEDTIIIDMTPEEFEQFYKHFAEELSVTKSGFAANGWILTVVVTLVSGVIAYFVSGVSLKPLREFSAQAEQIQAKNLTDVKLNEDTISEFQVLSHSINDMLDRLSAAFDAQKQFAGNAAHELRTPLALMQARLDLYRKDPGEARETIALLAEQTERMTGMVKTLLAMSELETIPRNESVALAPLIEEVLTDLAPLADKQDIKLSQEGGPVNVTGSDLLLYRQLFNLVENGIKYNKPHGYVTVSLETEDQHAVIRVSDTGCGIPEKDRKNIFQPFYRVDKSRSRSLGGAGLGLSLVWEAARLHGGSVRIEESSAAGTTFAVRLPIH